jgi:hypothetical protein
VGTLREWAEKEFQSSDVILLAILVLIFGLALAWGKDNVFVQDLIKMAMGGALAYIQKDAERGR